MELITELPLWFIIFCLLLGAAYAFILYYRENTFNDASRALTIAMAAFRFLSVSFIAMLLLSPLIKTTETETEKPIVIIAHDNSESIVVNKDSAYYRNEFPASLQNLSDQISTDFDVRTFSFGDRIEEGLLFNYNDKQTNFSSLFDEINTRYSNRNIGAIIVASDGLVNQGANPLYAPGQTNIPIFTIALGDTTMQKDIVLSGLKYNPTVYFNNNFHVELQINARKCAGCNTTLTVTRNDEIVMSRNINITNNNFYINLPVFFEAKEKGVQKYRFSLSTVADEISTTNNSKEIYIDVLEGRQKVLILANSPHPDLSAFSQVIEANQNFQSIVALADQFTGQIKDYNLIILHNLPSSRQKVGSVIQAAKDDGIPLLFVVGSQTSIPDFNKVQKALSITDVRGTAANEVQAALAPEFSLFSLADQTTRFVSQFPPLVSPFGTYQQGPNSSVLFYQQVGIVRTNNPLVSFMQDGQRIGVIAGEGMWRWRLRDYAEHENHDITNEIFTKIVQYMSVKDDRSRFRIITRNNYLENEQVQFFSELYNQSFELVNTPEVSITITGSDDKTYPFTFSRTEKAYALNAGYFPPGDYRYTATARFPDQTLSASGRFTVSALQVETNETVADHQVLFALAEKYDGQMFYPADMGQLPDLLKQREDIKPVVYTQNKLRDLINLKWVFFVLLLLISAEWFMRKRNGGY
ncbi:MAG: hypothetical protein ACR2GN_03690 [Bacteroidia bacterium]